MKVTPLAIEGAWVAEINVWHDDRGFFREWFKHEEVLRLTGIDFSAMQANFSLSKKGVIRGIHYSLAPEGQAKWVTCVSGSIVDVIVDIRPNSPTYKKIEYIELNSDKGVAVLIGPGLGHGFISLAENSGVSYLLNSPYNPAYELELSPIDIDLGIRWQKYLNNETEIILSEKDRLSPSLMQRELNLELPKC
jgi:dTDP-4-dehydrorhamnose 3,5-epimerase